MRTVRRTNRWRGVIVVALVAAAIGVLAKRPDLLLAGIVGVAYAAYPQFAGEPAADVSIDRSVSDDAPAPGERVEVTVTVRNEGDRTLWDCRIVDGVPPMLAPIEGTARHAAVLRPGAATSFSYALRAAYGTHRFDPATIVARDAAGAVEVETRVAADTALECATAVPGVTLRRQTELRAGRIPAADGGAGVEFHGTREYRPGDPLGRIAWRRFARDGELTTVEFREERAAAVAVCLDTRPAAYQGRPDEPHAVAHARAAAEHLVASVAANHDRVGLAALGREFDWLAPAGGPAHAIRARRLLAANPAFSLAPPTDADEPPDLDAQLATLRARLGAVDQVLLLTPLPDEAIVRAALTLEATGHAVTVISPDVTARDTVGGRLAAVERDNRIRSLRAAGVPVIDWAPDDPLGAALARATERGPPS